MLQNIQRDLPFLECGIERKTKIINPLFFPWIVSGPGESRNQGLQDNAH